MNKTLKFFLTENEGNRLYGLPMFVDAEDVSAIVPISKVECKILLKSGETFFVDIESTTVYRMVEEVKSGSIITPYDFKTLSVSYSDGETDDMDVCNFSKYYVCKDAIHLYKHNVGWKFSTPYTEEVHMWLKRSTVQEVDYM